jgi:hypothetical protein
MDWFTDLVGFKEESPDQVRAQLRVEGDRLISAANGRTMIWGSFEVPPLAELRARVAGLTTATATATATATDGGTDAITVTTGAGDVSVREVVGNVQDLHLDPESAGALFQVASQFNALEMVRPDVTPERGVGIYENDYTQGPACAIAAGAGTLWRNYFVPIQGQVGQTATVQLDTLADLGQALGNQAGSLWQMRNGYALASEEGLAEIANRLAAASEDERERLRGLVRAAVQWDTEVTLRGAGHLVTQVYASALPVAYSRHASDLWEPFARLVLEAAYEATLAVAVLNQRRTGNPTAFLTRLGGGAFGNRASWIDDSLHRAIDVARGWHLPDGGLDVVMVRYG